MSELVLDATARSNEGPVPSVDEAAERLLRVLPPMFKRVMGEARMQFAAEFPIGETTFRIIHSLDHRDFTVSEMAEMLQVRTPTISRMIDTLVEHGYVDRQPDPADRRKVWLRLTPAGQDLGRHMEAAFCRTVARFLQPLSGADLALVVAACDTLETLLASGRPTQSKKHHIREVL